MPRTLSGNALASIHAVNTAEVWLVLLTISGSGMTTIRVVNNTADITSRGQVYQAFPFEIILPTEDGDNVPRASLRIDNVDRQIVEAVRQIQTPPQVTIEVIMASAPDTPEVSFANLVLRNVTYDAGYVQGELAYESIFTEAVTYTMTPSRFPGLFLVAAAVGATIIMGATSQWI